MALVGKGSISNYFFGLVQNVFYFYLALQAVFFGEVMFEFFYVITQFWGLYTWRKNMTKEPEGGTRLRRFAPAASLWLTGQVF
ncbi:nicotinamide mononucleotide transporter [Rothia sp. ZJ1223]|nr:nicotinamide mononucleotide transporter [Rothia sp. ZJ1223]